MRFLKKLWKSFIQALKEFWEWLKRLFARKKKVVEESPKPEPVPEKLPPEPVLPEEVTPVEEEVNPIKEEPPEIDNLNLLGIGEQSATTGFIRVHEVGGYRIVQEHFQSLEHLINCLSNRRKNTVMMSAGCDSSNKNDSSFSGVNSYQSAVNLMRSGYTDILPKIEKGTDKSVKKLSGSYQRKKSILSPNFSGAAPSVPRHLMGLPDDMLNRNVIPRKTKTIYIAYAPHAAWFVDKKTFINAGIALLSAIQLIENSGISVKLDCIFCGGKSDSANQKEAVFGVVPLKDYSGTLNLQKLCFPIAHPAMLRRIGFRFLETTPQLRSTGFTGGYGCVMSKTEILKTFKTNSKVIILDTNTIDKLHYNVESIIRYIKNAAER